MSELTLARFVRPWVVDHGADVGEPVRIEDALERRLDERAEGTLFLQGPPGAGKRTALEYVRLFFRGRPQLVIGVSEPVAGDEQRLRVCTYEGAAGSLPRGKRLELLPWTRDEWIEYLLARHRDACSGVMARLEAPETELELKGRPLVWAAILDELATDPGLPDAFAALRRAVRRRFSSASAYANASRACWAALSALEGGDELTGEFRMLAAEEPEAAPFLAQGSVHVLLAAEHVTEQLTSSTGCPLPLPLRIARPLLRATRPLLCTSPAARETLALILGGKLPVLTDPPGAPERGSHASAAGLLHLFGPTALADDVLRKLSPGMRLPRLVGAELEGLEAPGATLCEAKLDEAHLRGARLDGADMGHARLNRTDLRGASLCGAKLVNATARAADFSHADLRGAWLDGATLEGAHLDEARLETALLRKTRLEGASLRGALLDRAELSGVVLRAAVLTEASLVDTILEGAILDGVDLRAARLATTRLARASLVGCNLEQKHLEAPDFTGADLHDAHLTGSRFPRANLRGAQLGGAGLAHVEWPDADLSGADLTNASFHLGSTRSGLLVGAPASWGTHTGFYTEELRDQGFKRPEEFRKADLRRVDLRGARIFETDFYLVDLRGAHFTEDQGRHLRACGAIL